jgi:hypothetical protein
VFVASAKNMAIIGMSYAKINNLFEKGQTDMAISVDSFLGQLKDLDNENIIKFLGEMQIAEYIHNPWFLGGMGVLAVCCLIFKWRVLLATIVGLTGLAWLVSYTVEKQGAEVSAGLKSNNLIFFIGGGIAIISVMIYLVFIKEE